MVHPMVSLLRDRAQGDNLGERLVGSGTVFGEQGKVRRAFAHSQPSTAQDIKTEYVVDGSEKSEPVEESRGMGALRSLSFEVEWLEKIASLLETKLDPLLSTGEVAHGCGRVSPVGESLLVRVVNDHVTRLADVRHRLEEILTRFEI